MRVEATRIIERVGWRNRKFILTNRFELSRRLQSCLNPKSTLRRCRMLLPAEHNPREFGDRPVDK